MITGNAHPVDHGRTAPARQGRAGWLSTESLSLGAWIIVLLALLSSLLVFLRPSSERRGIQMWTRARTHFNLYEPIIARWNETASEDSQVALHLLSDEALERRMLSGFLSDTYVADLIELERRTIGQVFTGPAEQIGFVDLTDRLRDEGIYDQINAPSFSPWTSRGRIYGLPHDVHPVLLVYRADLVAEAGIDVTAIHTWDDFARLLRPLITDFDGDGYADRYLLNAWHTNMDICECLILQAGGAYFDDAGQPIIASAINAHVISVIVTWTCGPNRIAIDAPEFTAAGNQLKLAGQVVASLAPDWLCGVWKTDMPGLAGKLRVMPLPAWTPGGRRTSVWGGSVLGIARSTAHPDAAWQIAKRLYLDADHAEQLFRKAGIITPVKALWEMPVYDEPAPYFGGQAVGRQYVEAAPAVPMRTSSPYNMLAKARVQDAVITLRRYALEHSVFDPESLRPQAEQLLLHAQRQVERQIARNVFLRVENP